MQRRIRGRTFVVAAGLTCAALAATVVVTCAGVLGGAPEWRPWATPADLPERGPWSHDFANFVALRFDDVEGLDVEVRSGTLPPKGMPLRELRFRRAGRAAEWRVASDRGAGNGELVIEGGTRGGRAFRVDVAGRIEPVPGGAGPLEGLRDDLGGDATAR